MVSSCQLTTIRQSLSARSLRVSELTFSLLLAGLVLPRPPPHTLARHHDHPNPAAMFVSLIGTAPGPTATTAPARKEPAAVGDAVPFSSLDCVRVQRYPMDMNILLKPVRVHLMQNSHLSAHLSQKSLWECRMSTGNSVGCHSWLVSWRSYVVRAWMAD